MIKLLLTETLSQKVVGRLNEIPEFEIVIKTGMNARHLQAEIKDYEAVERGKLLFSGGMELYGKTAGIIGMGRIGKARERAGFEAISILKGSFNV